MFQQQDRCFSVVQLSDTLLDQKSSALLVLVADGGDNTKHIHEHCDFRTDAVKMKNQFQAPASFRKIPQGRICQGSV